MHNKQSFLFLAMCQYSNPPYEILSYVDEVTLQFAVSPLRSR
jgi:hypothetical protein